MKLRIKRTLISLLMIMIVVTLVPNIGGISKAYAEVMDPLPAVTVGYIDENGYGTSVFLTSEKPYYVNGAHEATSDSSVDWNAYYNASTGVLTYNNYHGTGVDIRTDRGILNIKLIGDNYIGGKGQFGIYIQDELGISSECGGKLTIEAGMQDATSYGIRSNHDSIFLSGNADIIIRMNSNDSVYGIKSEEYSVIIMDQASVDIECKSTESFANGIDAKGFYVTSPYMIHYKGEGYGSHARFFNNLNQIMLADNAVITADIKSDSENCVYDPISELRNMLNESDYRVVLNEEDGWYHASIEPKKSVESPIRINYDKYTLPDIHLCMTGEEAYEKYLDALECPTNENYDGSYGWYVNLDSAFSGISDDTGEGANLNTSSERFEFGEPYYIMFAISIDEENFIKNENQEFEVNGSDDIIWSEGIDPDTGKFQYIVAIQQTAGYGPLTYVYAGTYNTVKYSHNDTVSFDDVNYNEYTYQTIELGKELTLYAKAAEDDEFLFWRKGDRTDGEIISTNPVVTVTIDGDDDYYAIFQPKIPASGKYNDSVDFTFDEATGTLTLIPTGDDGEGGKTGILDFKGWGQSPFYKNNKIKHVIIQEGITDIREAVFEENELETVSLPASLTGLHWRAFEDCYIEGDGFTVDAASENFKAVDGSLFSKDGTIMHKFVKKPGQTEYTIPEGVTWIIGECFDKTELDKVTLRGEGLNVDDYAFDYCTLGEVIIEEGVSEVDYQRSTLLADSITFPSTITWINAGGFIDSENLKNIYVSDDNPYFGSIDGVLFNYEYADGTPESDRTEFILQMYPWGKTATSYTVPDGVTTINGMSMQTPNLKEIVIPESVNAIKYYAFAYRHESPITVQINNPECQLDSDIFDNCDDVTIKAVVGSTGQVFAEEHEYKFVPIGESHGKLKAPKNVRWDGTTAKWDAVPGVSDVRYSVKFYEVNEDGTLYHVSSLDETITDGSTECTNFRQRMFYKDAQYCFTVTASAVGYETSNTVQSPYANGLFDKKTELPTVVRDTLVFPTNASPDIEGVNYFHGNLTVWNSSDEKVMDRAYFSDPKPQYNLRDRFVYNELPYGTYKIQADLAVDFYGWSAWIIDAPEDQYVYYDYQPVSDITKIEVTIPQMITGMRSYCPSGLEVKAYAGSEQLDGIYTSSSEHWNNWQYRDSESGVYNDFPDRTIEKGKYQYSYKLEIDKYHGYKFADEVEIYVNGSSENVTITSKYDEEIDIRYEYPVGIQPLTMITEEMVGDIAAKTYTGSAIKPKPVVKDGEVTLKSGTDYTVSYKNNINAGEAFVVIKGKNEYTGTVEKAFTITPKKITPKVSLSVKEYTYNGKAKKPKVTVKDGANVLDKINYTVTYASGRKNVGKYKVTVKLTGNYVGTKAVYFKINPKGTTLGTLKAASKAVTVNWKTQTAKMSTKKITGYQVMLATNSKFTKDKKTVTISGYSKASKKVTGLKAGKKYYVKIRTYTTISGTKYYSPWSKSKTVTTKK